MKASRSRVQAIHPARAKLTAMQAERLSAMSDISIKELAGRTVEEIEDRIKFQIDPMLLFFRKFCGRVVKKDPISGNEYPVPYATVHVEDTDCSLIGFFPPSSKWAWYFPFKCRRETIATATTDECGRFCVWIPRWDIDWVLKFRRERYCFPIIFQRPSIRDLLEELIPSKIPFPLPEPGPLGPRPGPGPDPAPVTGFDRGRLIRQVEDQIGREAAAVLDRVGSRAAFGASNAELTEVLGSPAYVQQLPPPLPNDLQVAHSRAGSKQARAELTMDTVRTSLTARLKLDAGDLKALDLRAYLGPFKRCFDVFVPEWVPIIDVPDITFRVTQDTDGDGIEEEIYSEGLFQVRWDAALIGSIKINAKPNARAGLECGGDRVPCADVPAIVLAGRMPVVDAPTSYDPVNGYALRPNRPHPSGLFTDLLPNPDAASPFRGVVSLLGCNKTDPAATHYRIMYRYSNDSGASFTAPAPFVGWTWPLFRLDGAGHLEMHYPAADAQGWYPIALPAGPNPFLPQDLLLDWPTYARADGRYALQLQLGAGGVVSSSSAEVAFNIDNAYPNGPLTVEWRTLGGVFQLLAPPCPVVKRGAVPVELEFRVTLDASATHLRSARIEASGCGGGDIVFLSGSTAHWHTSTSDNSELLQAIFRLPATAHEGTYSFSARVSSRAFNPNGGDPGHLILPEPWEYDPDDIHIDPGISFSVIDAN